MTVLALLLVVFTVMIIGGPTQPDLTSTTVAGSGLQSATSSIVATFLITAKDEAGAARTSGGDLFAVDLKGAISFSGTIKDNLDGTYSAAFTPTKSGSYTAEVKLLRSGGLSGDYFENMWFFYTPALSRIDAQVSFDWGLGAITASGTDYVSIRWTGKLKPQFSETYTFSVTSDDGSRLWVDGTPLIDRWDTTVNNSQATIQLVADNFYDIKMEYKEISGTANVQLGWSSQSVQREIIPAKFFYYQSHIKGSPFSLTVQPGSTCAGTSTASGAGLASTTAGKIARFTVQCNDASSNMRAQGAEMISVRSFPQSVVTPAQGAVTDYGDSSYGVSYTPSYATSNSIWIQLVYQFGAAVTYYSYPTAPNDPTTGTALGTKQVDVITFAKAANTPPLPSVSLTWSARYVGFIKAYFDGVNTFSVTVGTIGEQAKVWVDNSVVIDLWAASATALTKTGTINLRTSVSFYDLKIDYASVTPAGTSNQLTFQWFTGATYTTITSTSLFHGFHIKNSPINVAVFPAGSCATTSNMYGPALTVLTAGVPASFTIYSRDAYGNVRTEGRSQYLVQLSGADSLSGFVNDTSNGNYAVTFTPTKSGSYNFATTLSSAHINLSPRTGTVSRPSRRHLPSSSMTGIGLTLATSGIQSVVTLTVRDVFGNLQPESSWNVLAGTGPNLAFSTVEGISVSTPSPNPNCPTDCPDGITVSTVVLRYTITTAGTYKLQVAATNLLDGSVKGSPFSLTVSPHLLCATTSTAAGSDFPRFLTLLTAGVAATFSVTVRDMYSNLRTASTLTDVVCFTRQTGLRDRNGTTVSAGINTGVFSANAAATLAGTQQIWAQLVNYGGLFATYYSVVDLPAFWEYTVKALDFSTTSGMTTLSVSTNLKARFAGLIRAGAAGTHTFSAYLQTANQERVALWVDNTLVINQWTSIVATLQPYTGTINIDANEANSLIDILINYRNYGTVAANPGLTMKWTTPTTATNTIPTTAIAASFHVSGSPFSVNVIPGLPCATVSRISSQGLSVTTVGVPSTFSFTSRDSFNNIVTSSSGTSNVTAFSFSLLRNSILPTYFANLALLESVTINDGGSVVSTGSFSPVVGSPGTYQVTYIPPTIAGRLELEGSKIELGGLTANYFENPDLCDNGQFASGSLIQTNPTITRVDASIDFTWGSGQPISTTVLTAQSKLISADYFSVRWTGWIMPNFTEVYTFSVEADDGARLWINNLKIVDSWGLASGRMSSVLIPAMKSIETDGTISLVAGTMYSLKLDYQELDGNATAILRWSSKSQTKMTVPSSRLYYRITGSAISNAGGAVVVQPSVTCAAQSTAFGQLISLATAGIATTFTIVLRDQYGNERRQGDILHARVAPVSSIYGRSFPTTQGTRLAHLLYPGGLSATYYNSDSAFTTTGSTSVTGYGCDLEPWDNPACARGPWVSATSWSFGASFPTCAPAFVNNAYAVRWKGFFKPDASAAAVQIKIDTSSAAGCTATLNVNNQGVVTATASFNLITLAAPVFDQPYPIDVTLVSTGGATNHMALSWWNPSAAVWAPIPTTRLFPLANRYSMSPVPITRAGDSQLHAVVVVAGGVQATYYDNEWLSTPKSSRIDQTINFDALSEVDYSTSARTTRGVALSDMQSFSIRWAGLLKWSVVLTPASTFTFQVTTGSYDERVRLFVDGNLLIDKWDPLYSDSPLTTVWIATTVINADYEIYTDFRLDYQETANTNGKVKLEWAAQGLALALIPSQNLFRAVHISGSPFPPFKVFPAVYCATVSTVRGTGLSTATPGVVASYTIQSRDQYNNERQVGGDVFYSRLHLATCATATCPQIVRGNVTDRNDSSYEALYTATRSGVYSVLSSMPILGGVSATYYAGIATTAPIISVALFPTIEWTTGTSAQYPEVGFVEPFMARYQGMIRPEQSGMYTFTYTVSALAAFERGRLLIENTLIIDKWSSAFISATGTFYFVEANAMYDITLDYANSVAQANKQVHLTWLVPGTGAPVVVPSTRLFARDDVDYPNTFQTVVGTTSTQANNSFAFGPGLTLITAGVQTTFTISTYDVYGNRRTAGGDTYSIRILDDTSSSSLQHLYPVQSSAANLATYVGSYSVTFSGVYSVSIRQVNSGGLNSQWFDNMWLSGTPAVTRVDSQIDYNWNLGPIGPLQSKDFASVRWSGMFGIPITEVSTLYSATPFPLFSEVITFTATVTGGVRFYLNGTLVIDQWEAASGVFTATLLAVGGVYYDITLEYRANTDAASVQLAYSSQSLARRAVPASRFFSSASHIFGSPFLLSVEPSFTCGSISNIVTGTLATTTTAGVLNTVRIQARDTYGNARTAWSDATTDFFAVRVVYQPNSAALSSRYLTASRAVTPGQYSGVWSTTTAGANTLYAALPIVGGLDATFYSHPGVVTACWETGTCAFYLNTLRQTIDWSTALGFHTFVNGVDMGPSGFSARYYGFYRAPISGVYTFEGRVAQTDERMRLWVDNTLVIDSWTSLASTICTAAVLMSFGPAANNFYEIQLQYLESNIANSAAKLSVNYGFGMTVIPSDRFYSFGTPVIGTPSNIVVKTGPTDISMSPFTWPAPLSLTTAGYQTQYTIVARDTYGNYQTLGGDNWKIIAQGSPTSSSNGITFVPTVTDLNSGTYIVSYTPTQQGVYDLFNWLRGHYKTETVYVNPGDTCGPTSVASGPALSIGTAGVAATFTILTKDAYSNIKTVPNDARWYIRIRGGNGNEAKITTASYLWSSTPGLKNLGRFAVPYRTTSSGTFSIDVRQASNSGLSAQYFRDFKAMTVSALVKVDPTPWFSWPAEPNSDTAVPDQFSVRWTGYIMPPDPTSSHYTYTFQTTIAEADERVRLWVNDHWIIDQWSSVSALTVTGTISGLQCNALYDIKLEYAEFTGLAGIQLSWSSFTVAGPSQISTSRLFSAATPIKGSPFSLSVFPHIACASMSFAKGTGISLATAGVQSVFTIYAKDHLGNTRTEATDVFVVNARPSKLSRGVAGTVSAIAGNTGKFHAVYVPTYKENSADPWPPTLDPDPFHELQINLLQQNGIRATYYDTATSSVLQTPFSYSVYSSILYSNTGVPTGGTTADFGIRWVGFVRITSADTYTFTAYVPSTTNRAVKLWVDNLLIVSQWPYTGPPLSGVMTFTTANSYFDIKMEYYAQDATAGTYVARLDYTCCGGGSIPFPSSNFFVAHDIQLSTHQGGGLAATYWNDAILTSGPIHTVVDDNIDWSAASALLNRPYPLSLTIDGPFSVRWTGFIRPSRSDLYTFFVKLQDWGNEGVKVWVDNTAVVTSWPAANSEPSGTFFFTQREVLYDLKVEYQANTVSSSHGYTLKWENTGLWDSAYGITPSPNDIVNKGVVPSSRLFVKMVSPFVIRDDRATWFPTATYYPCQSSRPTDCYGPGYITPVASRVLVVPGQRCATTSTLNSVTAYTTISAGQTSVFTLNVLDQFLNNLDTTADPFVGRALLTSATSSSRAQHTTFASTPDFTNPKNTYGRYTATRTITASGSYTYTVSLAGNENGLWGYYFSSPDLTGTVSSRIDQNVMFNWGTNAPTKDGIIGADNFSVRWLGLVQPLYGEVYTFFANADDGTRLWVDNALVFDSWTTSRVESFGTIQLIANVLYDIKLEYKEVTDTAFVELRWASISQIKSPVPPSRLYPGLATVASGFGALTITPAMFCGSTTTQFGAATTLLTAGVQSTFTIAGKDQFGNRCNSAASSWLLSTYQLVPRVLHSDWATSSKPTRPGGYVPAAPAGSEYAFIAVTQAGVHSLYTSQAIGSLTSAPSGLQATYYQLETLTLASRATSNEVVDFSLNAGTAPTGLTADGYWSIRWAGFMNAATATSPWTFSVTVLDSDERVRLWVSNSLVINQWSSLTAFSVTGTIGSLNTAQFYDLKVEYTSFSAGVTGSKLTLGFDTGTGIVPMPASYLYQRYDAYGSPTSVRVLPNLPSGPQSTVSGIPITLGTAGVPSGITVTVRDSYNNLRSAGGDFVSVRFFAAAQTGLGFVPTNYPLFEDLTVYTGLCPLCNPLTPIIRVAVTDNLDSTYSATPMVTTSGCYALVTSIINGPGGLAATYWSDHSANPKLVSTGGTVISGFPASGAASPTFSGAVPYIPGINTAFVVRWVGFVRPSMASTYTFTSTLTTTVGDETAEVWLNNLRIIDQTTAWAVTTGTFTFPESNAFYDLSVIYKNSNPSAGSLGLKLQWSSYYTPLQYLPTTRLYARSDVSFGIGPPFIGTCRMYAFPGVACAAASIATSTGALTKTTAGVASTFSVSARDAYSNPITTTASTDFKVSLYGQYGAPTPILLTTALGIVKNNPDQYVVSYTATVAKLYENYIQYNNDNVKNGPFQLTVLPHFVCGSQSIARGIGLTSSRSLISSLFTITARDMYSNNQNGDVTSATSFFVSRITRTPPGLPAVLGPTDSWDGSSVFSGVQSSFSSPLRGSLQSNPLDGTYPFTWTQDPQVTQTTMMLVSWAQVGGLMATYYSSGTLNFATNTGLKKFVTNTADCFTIDTATTSGTIFVYTYATPGAAFAARYQGFLRPSLTTTYTIKLDVATNSERMRLWLDNYKVIDLWTSMAVGNTATATAALTLNVMYDITVEYIYYGALTGGINRKLNLQFATGGGYAPIPTTYLYNRYDVVGSPFAITAFA